MIYKDYYKILDLKTSRVSIDEIKVAYRAAAKISSRFKCWRLISRRKNKRYKWSI